MWFQRNGKFEVFLETEYGNPLASAQDFSPQKEVFRRHFFCRMCKLSAVAFFRAPWKQFDIFAAWVLLWKTRSRQIGERVCLVAQFDFFNTAFDPRVWTMVVFWKEFGPSASADYT